MIPHRMLRSEIYGIGVKDRVTACRKRLRVNRTRAKALVHDEDEDLFPETTAFSPFDDSEGRDNEGLLMCREQEVGIR